MTILRWIRKYSLMIGEYTNKLNLNVGNEIEVDEMLHKTRGKETWLVNGIDTKTRFMIFSEHMKARTKEKIKGLLIDTKQRTENQIKVVTTDGFLLYRNVVLKSFGYNNKEGKYNIRHNIVNASQGEGFNYKVERLHSNIRERTKVFRGFGSLESARAILIGYSIFHNFVKRHQAINKIPYELALPDLKLGTNKWLDLIKLANTNNIK
jgi:transposase-like protein